MPRVLLTRPKPESEAVARALAPCGFEATIWPLMRIETTLTAAPDYAALGGLIFTSANGVRALAGFGASGLPAFCVGAATARAARAAGFSPVIDAAGDGAALVEIVLANLPPAGRPLAHVRGADIRVDIAAALRARGVAATEIVAYRAVPADSAPGDVAAALGAGRIDVAAFYSPRSAEIFAALAGPWAGGLAGAAAVAISDAAAAPLAGLGFDRIRVAARPDGDAMRAAICGAVN